MRDVAIAKTEFNPDERAVTKLQHFQVHSDHLDILLQAYYSLIQFSVSIAGFLRFYSTLSPLLGLTLWLCIQC